MIKQARAGHTGGSLSCVDILNVLYNSVMNVTPENFGNPDRDRYIQSKGHSVEALQVALAEKGFISEEDLESLCRYRSPLISHPTRKVKGIEQNTGALGHGLSFGVGVSLAGKLDNKSYRVYVLLGDGELAEGSNWEASLMAARYHLDNLVVLVDRNRLQITSTTENVSGLEPLADKFKAFGYSVRKADGNNLVDLARVFREAPFEPGKPSLIIAQTVKGCGVSFMENTVGWHHRVPNDEEFARAIEELNAAETRISASPSAG